MSMYAMGKGCEDSIETTKSPAAENDETSTTLVCNHISSKTTSIGDAIIQQSELESLEQHASGSRAHIFLIHKEVHCVINQSGTKN